jgi:threonylcarbamoyladenosine tRNA methylthiotransferase MtaB
MKKSEKNPKSVAVATLGCKVNQCESASFQSGFEEHGLTVCPFSKPADIYVINTCAVTAKAAAQSRQLIRRAQRTNSRAKIVVTGCYAQIAPEKIREIETGSISIVGNANKHQLLETVLSDKTVGMHFNDITLQKEISLLPVKRFPGRTRAFLKVQDGCNNFCSYCIVPYARGRSRSLAMDKVLDQARGYAEQDHREIVITGIHVGLYGLDLNPPLHLFDLLKQLSALTPEVRYRLSSLEPSEISRNILKFMAEDNNFMPHLHIPLQSGSDKVLKKMNRRYTARQFTEKVKYCREMVPEMAVGVDVVVGFPGETEEDFLNTFDLLNNLPITYFHVFPYSKRPGTPAAKMKDQVPAKIKDERVAVLRKLDNKKRSAFHKSRIGKVHQVLVETEKTADGKAKGFTDNYIPVHFETKPGISNKIVPVKLVKLEERYVLGTLL